MGGVPGQAVQAIQGQTYGNAVRQEALQKTMPSPNQQAAIPTPRPVATQSDQTPPVENQPAAAPDVMSQIAGMGGILRAADDDPNIPITDGLSTGPGRGPQALMGGSQMEQMLRRLALQTNDPVFYDIMAKVGF